ncbi:alpha/beta fold hydrolase [Saccharibacillus sp. CPCC 101409]|uniref:alpha/beta hydrolase n=1 Tax=Saccharibacillus sp. CPCC 101409 TaxID=3058041 RepID=UPI0026721FFB|nr:alpha/beta fold hydrolase [Saccharibacillus sp. CPCC 101409]MDO3411933.1 alpha/beta fold hydrolase [Saccharibacillus sp. CPCC 101409]
MEACLLIHGFTGDVHEVAPLADFLTAKRYRVQTFTLSGHGGSRKEMQEAGGREWIASAERELKLLLAEHDRVHLIGFSTGALIATRLAAFYGERIASLSLLSTPVFPLNPPAIARTLAQPKMVGRYIRNLFAVPPRAAREFYRIVDESLEWYEEAKAPALIVQGMKDHLVKRRSGAYLREHLGSSDKILLELPLSGHLVCHSPDQLRLFEAVQERIETASQERSHEAAVPAAGETASLYKSERERPIEIEKV